MTTASETPDPMAALDPLLGEEYFRTPEVVLERMRREDPVHFIAPIGGWMVTRFDDVVALFSDERVTNDQRAFEHYVPRPEGSYMRWLSEHNFFSASPEEHARLRRLVSASLTPRGVRRMEGQIRDVV